MSEQKKELKTPQTQHSQNYITLLLPDMLVLEIVFFLNIQDLSIFFPLSRKTASFDNNGLIWKGKIKTEFKRSIPVGMPHLLESKSMYRILKTLNQLDTSLKEQYTENDPSLFQSRLAPDTDPSTLSTYLYKAAAVGNLPFMQSLTAEQQVVPTESILESAACSGNVLLMQWLLNTPWENRYLVPGKHTLDTAIYYSHLAIIQLLIIPGAYQGQPLIPAADVLERIASLAIRKGDLTLARSQLARISELYGLPREDFLINILGSNPLIDKDRHIEFVEELIREYKFTPGEKTLHEAIIWGHSELAEKLMTTYQVIPSQETLNLAIQYGHISVVKTLIIKCNLIPGIETLNLAVLSDDLEFAEVLITKYGITPDQKTLEAVFFHENVGDNKYIQFARKLMREQGVMPNRKILNIVARSCKNTELVEEIITVYGIKPNKKTVRELLNGHHFKLAKKLITEHDITPDQQIVEIVTGLYKHYQKGLQMLAWVLETYPTIEEESELDVIVKEYKLLEAQNKLDEKRQQKPENQPVKQGKVNIELLKMKEQWEKISQGCLELPTLVQTKMEVTRILDEKGQKQPDSAPSHLTSSSSLVDMLPLPSTSAADNENDSGSLWVEENKNNASSSSSSNSTISVPMGSLVPNKSGRYLLLNERENKGEGDPVARTDFSVGKGSAFDTSSVSHGRVSLTSMVTTPGINSPVFTGVSSQPVLTTSVVSSQPSEVLEVEQHRENGSFQ